MTTLADLGPRIVIMGPSNSGKSTLAVAIGRARGLAPVHLDQLHHQPGTDWAPRPASEFRALHDTALIEDRWVMDGNYTRFLPQRLVRATGMLLLDVPVTVSLWRYIRRCRFEPHRVGGLGAGRERVKWDMIHHIAVVTPRNRRRYDALADTSALPTIKLTSRNAIDAFYRDERLDLAGVSSGIAVDR